jgi:hypothetical protein
MDSLNRIPIPHLHGAVFAWLLDDAAEALKMDHMSSPELLHSQQFLFHTMKHCSPFSLTSPCLEVPHFGITLFYFP